MNTQKINKFKTVMCLILLFTVIFTSTPYCIIEADAAAIDSIEQYNPAMGAAWYDVGGKIIEGINQLLTDIYNYFAAAPVNKMKEALFQTSSVMDYIEGQSTSSSPFIVNRVRKWYDVFQIAALMFIPLIAIKVAVLLMGSWINPNNRKELKDFISTTILVIILLVFADDAIDWLVSLNDAIVNLFAKSATSIIPSVRPPGLESIGALLLAIIVSIAAWVMSLYVYILLFIRQIIIAFAYVLIPVAAVSLYTKQFKGILNRAYREIISAVFQQAVYAGTYVLLYDMMVYVCSFAEDNGFTTNGEIAEGFPLDTWFVQHVYIKYNEVNYEAWILGPFGWAVLLFLLIKIAKRIEKLFELDSQQAPDVGGLMRGGASLALKGAGLVGKGAVWGSKAIPKGIDKVKDYGQWRKDRKEFKKKRKSDRSLLNKMAAEDVRSGKMSQKEARQLRRSLNKDQLALDKQQNPSGAVSLPKKLAKKIPKGTWNLAKLATGVVDAGFALGGVTKLGEVNKGLKAVAGDFAEAGHNLKPKTQLNDEDRNRILALQQSGDLKADIDVAKDKNGVLYIQSNDGSNQMYQLKKGSNKPEKIRSSEDSSKAYQEIKSAKSSWENFSPQSSANQAISSGTSQVVPNPIQSVSQQQMQFMNIKPGEDFKMSVSDVEPGFRFVINKDNQCFTIDNDGSVFNAKQSDIGNSKLLQFENVGMSANGNYVYSVVNPYEAIQLTNEHRFRENAPILATVEAKDIIPNSVAEIVSQKGYNNLKMVVNPANNELTYVVPNTEGDGSVVIGSNKIDKEMFDMLKQNGVFDQIEESFKAEGIIDDELKYEDIINDKTAGFSIGLKTNEGKVDILQGIELNDNYTYYEMADGIRNSSYKYLENQRNKYEKDVKKYQEYYDDLSKDDTDDRKLDDLYVELDNAKNSGNNEEADSIQKIIDIKEEKQDVLEQIEDAKEKRDEFQRELNDKNSHDHMLINGGNFALRSDGNLEKMARDNQTGIEVPDSFREMLNVGKMLDFLEDFLKNNRDLKDLGDELDNIIKECNLDAETKIGDKEDLEELIELVRKKYQEKATIRFEELQRIEEIIDKGREIK